MSSSGSTNSLVEKLEQRVSEYQSRPDNNSSIKFFTGWLAFAPWKIILPIALLVGLGLVLGLRGWALRGVNLLQWGF